MAVIKGAIFDLDGVLLDSMGIWDDVDRAFFHLHGREMPSGYVDALNSMSFSEGAEYTRALIGYELTADEIIAEWHSLSVKLYAEDVRLKPGAEELLERLSASGISMAIATDLDEELALMGELDVMLSLDSANVHLASLAGIPVVSVWGQTHPYGGFAGWKQSADNCIGVDMPCRPCSVRGDKECRFGDFRCLERIDTAVVITRIEKIIGKGEVGHNMPDAV